MRVDFVARENGPDRLVCEAEVVFDEAGPFWNLKLVGFNLWRADDGDIYVTVPSRPFGAGRYFEFVRAADSSSANVKNLKSWIISEYHRRNGVTEPAAEPPIAPVPPARSRRRAAEKPGL